MSTLNGSSTLAQVQAAYDNNASYAEDGDVAKCRAFLTACRILLRRMPAESGTREAHHRLNPELIQKEMTEARSWLDANDTGPTSQRGPSTSVASFREFRC